MSFLEGKRRKKELIGGGKKTCEGRRNADVVDERRRKKSSNSLLPAPTPRPGSRRRLPGRAFQTRSGSRSRRTLSVNVFVGGEREERERERESRREKRASVSFEVKVEFFFFFGPGLAKEPSGKCTCSCLSLFLPLRRSPPRPPLRELRKHRRPRRRRLTRRTKNLSQRKRKKKRQRRRWDREKRHGARRRSSSSRKEELAREERPRRASRRGSAEKRGAPRRRRGGRCRCRRRAGGRLLRGASQGLIESWRRSSKKGERSEVVVSRSHPIELFVVETSLSLRKRVTDNQPLPSLLLSLSLFAFQNTSKPVPLSRNHEPRSLSRGRRDDEWNCRSPGSSDAEARRQRRRRRASVNPLQRAAQPPPPWGFPHRQERAQQVVRAGSGRDRWAGGFTGEGTRMFRLVDDGEQFFSLVDFFALALNEKKSPSSAPLSLTRPPLLLSCSLSPTHLCAHRANRDAFDDTEGENEDDYSFDR